MKKVFASVAAAAFVVALGAPLFAATQTIKGELIDKTCYTKQGAKATGAAHKDCAATCAKKGSPLALLTEDGKVYTITGDLAANNNEKLAPHVTHMVEVTGDVSDANGMMSIDGKSIKMAQ